VLTIRVAGEDDVEACVALLAALPEYFTPDTHDDLRGRYADCTVYVADDDGEVIGMAMLQPQYAAAEIYYARRDRSQTHLGAPRCHRPAGHRGQDARRVGRLRALRGDSRVLGSDGFRPDRLHRSLARVAAWQSLGDLRIRHAVDPLLNG
jgi:hypothetical protein